MSRSIGGVYSLPPGSAAVDNTIIDPVIYNALLADLEADLNIPRPIVAGGTGAASADGALTALGGGTTGKAVFTAADVAAALVALGLTNAQVPPGQVGHFYRVAAPAGWLVANGAAVSRTTYAALWAAMGSPNTGDGSTTFFLPDMRGLFPRGLDSGRGLDTGRGLGTYQEMMFEDHGHSAGADNQGTHSHGGATVGMSANAVHSHTFARNAGPTSGPNQSGIAAPGYDSNNSGPITVSAVNLDHVHGIYADGLHSHNIGVYGANGGQRGGETRPRNLALLACIKT